jgi:hypothetical protein
VTKITLEAGRWYGLTMYPGYMSTPYHSPIRVNAVRLLASGRSLLEIDFYNACYAEGAQFFTYRLKVLRREAHHMLAAIEDSDRSISLLPLDESWLGEYRPELMGRVTDTIERFGLFQIAMDRLCPNAAQ